MSIITTVLFILLVLIHLFRYIDNLFNPKKVVNKQPLTITNGKEREFTHLEYYLEVLKIPPFTSITHVIVEKHYYHSIMYLSDSNIFDQLIQSKRVEIESARKYLIDFLNYTAFIS